MLIKELNALKENQELVSIERNCHDEELTGFIHTATEGVIIMSLFSNDGDYEGIAIFETEQISEVYWGNREHKAITSLIDASQEINFPVVEGKIFPDILIELNSAYESLCLYQSHSEGQFNVGKILDHDKDWLKLHAFAGKKTLSPLNKLIPMDDISRIVIDSPYQKKIVNLHKTAV
ncbi:hypothetical protein ONV78_15770 [Hahella sp. CR1]|uniref:hypothetical protein n=1 Tax=Hahella sp. CR1 TaxID=2992807 RepID=UPI002440F609|nr:hypothetical protein [Hahella sp. CR1]MDG9669200.1 hypothetical protein [Hahella sp. CR1]